MLKQLKIAIQFLETVLQTTFYRITMFSKIFGGKTSVLYAQVIFKKKNQNR